jgi:hypothetical protein
MKGNKAKSTKGEGAWFYVTNKSGTSYILYVTGASHETFFSPIIKS